jgi:hypothetical protein
MSEYLRKQALVREISGKIDWLIGRSEEYRSCGHENKASEFSKVISEFASLRGRIQSGAYDAEPNGEVQRLRAALERIKKWAEDPEPGTMYKIWNLANETLKGDGDDA